MWDFLGNLASAGINYFTGQQNRQQQADMAQQNIALQREFAQSGIQWRVADAKAAGLHPLAALGAQTSSFSPVSIGSSDFGSMGQDVGRAIKAAGSAFQREDQDEKELVRLKLERGRLENDILKADLIGRVCRDAAQIGPQMPVHGVNPFGSEKVPMPRPGPRRMPSGEAVREDDLKQTIEDQPSPASGRPYGFQMPYHPSFGSAQAFEDRYGDSELAQTLKFLINTGADFEQWWKSDPLEIGGWNSLRGGDRSRWSRGTRNMRGGG